MPSLNTLNLATDRFGGSVSNLIALPDLKIDGSNTMDDRKQYTSIFGNVFAHPQYFDYNFLPDANHPHSKSSFCNTHRRQAPIPIGDCLGLQIP